MTDDPAARLADVLSRENEALARVDYLAAVALVPAKEAALTAMGQGPAPPPAQLRRLTELADANRDLLERAIAVQTEVIRMVARACAASTTMTHYNRSGAASPLSRTEAFAIFARV
jgi:hypothetical protein